jgi:hypothetical protein
MQKRFVIGLYPTFEAAKAAKDKELTEHPENNYQVRRKYRNFAVVHRVTTEESEQIIERANSLYRKRPKKRSRRSVADFPA